MAEERDCRLLLLSQHKQQNRGKREGHLNSDHLIETNFDVSITKSCQMTLQSPYVRFGAVAAPGVSGTCKKIHDFIFLSVDLEKKVSIEST